MIARLVLVLLAIASAPASLLAADLRVIGWNVQDSRAIPQPS